MAGDDAQSAVADALANPPVAAKLKGLPGPRGAFLLQRLLRRFSDAIPRVRLGRLDLPAQTNLGLTSLEVYPVARDRSAGPSVRQAWQVVRSPRPSGPHAAGLLLSIRPVHAGCLTGRIRSTDGVGPRRRSQLA